MKKFLLYISLLTLCMPFFTNCATKKMYYFGDYSTTLYHLEKDQNEESLLKHKQILETIVAESTERNLPVPPGIYAELGYINLKANNSKEAIALFQTEAKHYPESKLFMDRLIQSAELRKDSGADDYDKSDEKEPTGTPQEKEIGKTIDTGDKSENI